MSTSNNVTNPVADATDTTDASNAPQTLQDEVAAAGDAFQDDGTSIEDTLTDTQAFDNSHHTSPPAPPFNQQHQPQNYSVPPPVHSVPDADAHPTAHVSDAQGPATRPHQDQAPCTYPPNIGPRRLGIVTSYHARKGWGFIRDMYTYEVFFTHHTEVVPFWPHDRIGADTVRNFKNCLHTGEYVEFGVGVNPSTGEACAKHVTGLCGYTLQMDWATIRYIQTRDSRTGEISSVANTTFRSQSGGRPNDRSSSGRSNRQTGGTTQQRTREYGSTTIQQRRATSSPSATRDTAAPQQTRRHTSTTASTSTSTSTSGTSTVPSGWE